MEGRLQILGDGTTGPTASADAMRRCCSGPAASARARGSVATLMSTAWCQQAPRARSTAGVASSVTPPLGAATGAKLVGRMVLLPCLLPCQQLVATRWALSDKPPAPPAGSYEPPKHAGHGEEADVAPGALDAPAAREGGRAALWCRNNACLVTAAAGAHQGRPAEPWDSHLRRGTSHLATTAASSARMLMKRAAGRQGGPGVPDQAGC